MLNIGKDDVVASFTLGQGDTFYGQVVRFCATAGEEDFLGRAVYELRTLFAGGVDGFSSGKTVAM